MDYKTVMMLGGVVKEFSVTYAKKAWNKETGESLGGEIGGVFVVASDADADAVANAAYEYLKEVMRRNMAADMTDVVKSVTETPPPPPPQEELPLPPPPEPVREPVMGDAEIETFKVDRITIEFSKSGNKYAKVKGGKWTKYGVVAWEEVLAKPPLEWNIESLDAKDYGVPPGLEAVVLMDGDKPKKVLEWK